MERVYYIDHVSNDDINALSLKLNSMQEVSHIKINKDSISFNCARPDNIQNYLDESNMDYILKEICGLDPAGEEAKRIRRAQERLKEKGWIQKL